MAQITDFVTGFSGPIGMALNGNDLYVVDVVASKIVKIDLTATPPTATDVVTGLSDPRQLLIDGNDIYVAETNYNKISKIDLTDTPPKARTLITDLSGPQGMILIGNELYIAEIYGDKISKINIEDSTPTTVDVITGLNKPIQFVLNGDDLYISEPGSNSRISKIDITDPSPTATAVVSTGIPNFITLYENEIYISDQTEKKITKFDITAAKPTKIDVVTELNQPAGIAIKDDILYISEYTLRKIVSTQLTLSSNEGMFAENIRTTLDADLKWTSESYTDQIQALCARIAIYLGEVRKSALFDKISIGEDSKIITQATIINALIKSNLIGKVTKSKIEELGTFYNGDLDSTYDKLCKLLTLVFNYVKDSLPNLWEDENNIIVMNKGIYGIVRLQSDIIDFLLEKGIVKNISNLNKVFEESKTYLDPIITFFETMDEETELALRKAYGGNGDIKYWRTLQQQVSEVHEDFQPDGLDEYNKKEAKEFNTRAFEIIRDLETFFKIDFQEKLEDKFGGGWFKKGVPPQVAKKANEIAFEKNLKIENEEDEVEVWDCLTIIAYRAIALKNWRDVFEKHYTKPTEQKISGGKDAKTQWMVKLEKLRNENFHQYSVTEEEFSFLEELHDWLIIK